MWNAPVTAMMVLALPTMGSPAGSALDDCLDLLDRLDGATMTIEYDEAPLRDVLSDLNRRSPATIRVDWASLIRLGVRQDDPVTLRLENGRLSTILGGLMLAMGDEFDRPVWDIHSGQVVITTLQATAAMRLTGLYDVRDLLAAGILARLDHAWGDAPDEPDEEDEETALIPEEPESSGRALDGHLRGDAALARILTPAEELALMVLDHVDPEAWMDFGGSLSRVSDAGGVLLVTAPPRTHQRLREALRQLRRAYPASIAIEAIVLDLPREGYERLSRRFEPGTAAMARAVAASTDGAALWSALVTAATGETATVRSEEDEVNFELELTPRLDVETGLIRLAVRCETAMEGEQRSINTTAAMAAMSGAAILELPPARAAATMRLLVLISHRQ